MSKFNAGQSFADGDTVTGAKLNNIAGLLDIYTGLISEQTAMSATVSTADQLLIADVDNGDSGAANRVTVQKLLNDTLTNGTFTSLNLTGNLNVAQLSTLGTINNTRGTVGILNSTTGTIQSLTSSTANISQGSAIFTQGTIGTLNTTTGTIGTLNNTTGTIGNLSTTLAGDFTISQGTATLSTTGATAATYGTTSAIPVLTIDAKGRVTSASSVTSPVGFRNRIINGDMRIDQRNAGAAVTINTTGNIFSVDRFFSSGQPTDGVFTLQQSSTAPSGFVNSVIATVTTQDASIGATQFYLFNQYIEGANVADLAWGTASAKTVTLSFWVRSSLTGTFGGAISNSAQNRAYPFTYTILAANTYEYKTITIIGDTSGTWLTTTGIGIRLHFDLGVGSTYRGTAGAWDGATYLGAIGATNVIGNLNATWYITGVQLEAGSTATEFECRPIGTELALCQRYYYRTGPLPSLDTFAIAIAESATVGVVIGNFPVTLRTSPSALEQSGTASDYAIRTGGNSRACSAVPIFDSGTNQNIWHIQTTVASGQTAGQGGYLRAGAVVTAYLGWSAEL